MAAHLPPWVVLLALLLIIFPQIATPFINLLVNASVIHSIASVTIAIVRVFHRAPAILLAATIDLVIAIYSGNYQSMSFSLGCYIGWLLDAAWALVSGLKRAYWLLFSIILWTFDVSSDIIGEVLALCISFILLIVVCNLVKAICVDLLALVLEAVRRGGCRQVMNRILDSIDEAINALPGISVSSGSEGRRRLLECGIRLANWVFGLLMDAVEGHPANHVIIRLEHLVMAVMALGGALLEQGEALLEQGGALLDWLDDIPPERNEVDGRAANYWRTMFEDMVAEGLAQVFSLLDWLDGLPAER